MPQSIGDFHVHPNYSFDAEGTIDEYCAMAIEKRLTELRFTTHYDADPKHIEREGFIKINGTKEKLSDESMAVYFEDVARAYQVYGSSGLMVVPGVEFGYFDGCEKVVNSLKSKFDVQYSLGAVHSIGDRCVCCEESARKLFSKLTLEQMADAYFELLNQAAETGLFDCLAHLDVYRRFGTEYYGEAINSIHQGRIEKLFETMARNNVGFELNSSALRHGLAEYYPTMDIINSARSAGVLLVSLGSDAHRPDDIGYDFEAASSVAYELFPYVDE